MAWSQVPGGGSRQTYAVVRTPMDEDMEVSDEVAEALLLQDEALSLLERLRSEEAFLGPRGKRVGGGRRDFRRWPTPADVTIDLHNGVRWNRIDCLDLGVGGARIREFPDWVRGPVPARLRAPGVAGSVLTMADVMWKDAREHQAGIRFEFQDEDERETWSGALIDALLVHHSLA